MSVTFCFNWSSELVIIKSALNWETPYLMTAVTQWWLRTRQAMSRILFFLLFFLFGLCQVASRAQWQLQISPGRGDIQTGPVVHGQVSQTRSPCQQGCPLRRTVRSALCQKPLWWGKELNTQAWSFTRLEKLYLSTWRICTPWPFRHTAGV